MGRREEKEEGRKGRSSKEEKMGRDGEKSSKDVTVDSVGATIVATRYNPHV